VKALRQTNRTARSVALLSLGALALHQLRYALAYGDRASQALAHQGHGYLAELGGVLIAVASAALLGTLLASALSTGEGRKAGRARAAWLHLTAAYALGLLAIFCAQELAEGALAAGHPAGVAAVFAGGGWIGLPLAGLLGLVCALASMCLRSAEEVLGRTAVAHVPVLRPAALPGPNVAPLRTTLAALNLGFGFARRPPPLQPAR
jgi:hypothetical protein